MDAVATLQARIEAQQDLDALIYGLRNLGGNREELIIAEQVAGRLLGCYVARDLSGWQLKRAKKLAQENVAAAKAAVAEIGTARQQRLALAA